MLSYIPSINAVKKKKKRVKMHEPIIDRIFLSKKLIFQVPLHVN